MSTAARRGAALAARRARVATAAEQVGLVALVGGGAGQLKHHGFLDWLVGVTPPLRPMYAVLTPPGDAAVVVASQADEELVRGRAPGAAVHTTRPAVAAPALAAEAAALLAARGLGHGRVGVAGLGALPTNERVALTDGLPEAELVDATEFVAGLKAIKDEDELDELRRTAAVVDAAHEALLAAARPGATELEVTAEAVAAGRRAGARDVVVFVGTGLHHGFRPTAARLPEGEPVTAYVEVCGENGYWVESVGVLWIGAGGCRSAPLVEAAEATLYAGEEMLRVGTTAGYVARAMTDTAAAAGVAIGTSHGLGHGVGAGDDDLPRIRPGEHQPLAPRMVVVLHPNVADAAAGASVTVGGTYVVRETRPERLSRLPLVSGPT